MMNKSHTTYVEIISKFDESNSISDEGLGNGNHSIGEGICA